MAANLYAPIFLYSVIALTIISLSNIGNNYQRIKKGSFNLPQAFIICTIYALWLGARPLSGKYFGDTSNYALAYQIIQNGSIEDFQEGEWIWDRFMFYCSTSMDVSGFFTLVDIGYFGLILWSCKRLTPNNVLVSVLFFMGSFSFFSYATNGIRNGLACSLILLSFSFLTGNLKDKVIAGLMFYVAFYIHHSTGLPILMSIISLFFIRSFKWAYTFWILSIFISLVAGETVTSFFASLGFDQRERYLKNTMDAETFSHTGFRWDFLIYSMMPILLGYYIVIKRGIRNATYEFLLNTYTLSNAFWVMIIRANYSNRFAYLSWFMYPIVLSFPLLKMDIWGDQQGRMLSRVMLAQVGFTWFMSTLY